MGTFIAATFSGCVDFGDREESSSSRDYTGNETEILVSVYAAGYGQGWIDEACRIYEEKHPEYRFKIRANSRMFDTVKTELTSGTCTSDIVLVAGYDYLNLATTGKLAELSSVYDSKIPDSEKTVREVVADEQYAYRLLGENKDKIYGIPGRIRAQTDLCITRRCLTKTAGPSLRPWTNFSRFATRLRRKTSRLWFTAAVSKTPM